MNQASLFADYACTHSAGKLVADGPNFSRCICGEVVSTFAIAEQRKAAGIKTVLEHERKEWLLRALRCVLNVARNCREFTADEVRLAISDDGMPEPHHPNVYGALMNSAVREGVCVITDRTRISNRPDAHSHRNPVWQSRIFRGETA